MLIALLVATAVHLGFQLTISVVAYPALLATPDPEWRAAHAAHGRRITPLVAVVYGALVVTAVGALLTARSASVVGPCPRPWAGSRPARPCAGSPRAPR